MNNRAVNENSKSALPLQGIYPRLRRIGGSIYRRLRLTLNLISSEMDNRRFNVVRMALKAKLDEPRANLALNVLTANSDISQLHAEMVRIALDPETNVGEGLRVLDYTRRPAEHPEETRYSYQQNMIQHRFTTGERILDIGSGGDPFPYATILADRYLQPTHHRSSEFRAHGKPVVVCDIQELPFPDRAFDYIICAHVLEHVDDPIRVCREIQRIGKAGFIETPTLMKDALFGWAKGMHKWHLVGIGDHLFFFEYDDRRAEGIRSQVWRDLILFQPSYHPLQTAFNANQDIFNTVLEWQDHFNVTVVRLDGSVQTL